MRSKLLAAAVGLAFALPGSIDTADAARISATGVSKSAPQGRAVWFIMFDEPALPSFKGFASPKSSAQAALKATSPAVTGARKLDVDAPASRAYIGYLKAQQQSRVAAAEALLGRDIPVIRSFDKALNAVVVELTYAEAQRIAKLPGVSGLEKERIFELLTDAGPRWIGAQSVWEGATGLPSNRGEGIVIGIVDSGISPGHQAFADIDPQNSYNHSNPRTTEYGLCTTANVADGCTDKLIGIYDFTECTGVHASDGCDDREANDGIDRTSHGTHVASIAAGNYRFGQIGFQNVSISGVAPRANLITYKVCEDEETCRGSWLVAGLDQAIADGVDAINFSIGGGATDPYSCIGRPCVNDEESFYNAFNAGIVSAVAAGNDGPLTGTLASPSNAPWVLSVANATHDRLVANRLIDLAGGATPPPNGGVLVGAGATFGYGPAPLVIPADFPLCGQGESLGIDDAGSPDGTTNPWAAGRFTNEIVVCQRGVQARLAKSDNVRRAGGRGFVLTNTELEGDSIVADSHSIPGTHMGFNTGQLLREWMGTGTGHTGRLEGQRVISNPSTGDRLAASSGRGSLAFGDYLKPNLTAPGSSILAAFPSNANGFLSGTSMASPHVAGAAALIIAAHPDWTAGEVMSVLQGTARPSIKINDGAIANVFEQGSGMTDVSKAVNAGIGLPITTAEFFAQRPAISGDRQLLNLPSLIDGDCFRNCVFDRIVHDLVGGGEWRIEFEMPAAVIATATPATFTLADNASQTLNFRFNVETPLLLGTEIEGRVRIIPVNGPSERAGLEFPVFLKSTVGNLPGSLSITTATESGYADFVLSGISALPDARFSGSALVFPTIVERTLAGDTTNDDAYDAAGGGTFTELVTVPAGVGVEYRFSANTSSATAPDVDLYVGFDADGDGQAEASEEFCVSGSPDDTELCEFTVEGTATVQKIWVLVQNWQASASNADLVRLEVSVIGEAPSDDGTLTVTGPGHTEAEAPFTIRVAFDDPTLLPGETRQGFVFIGAVGAAPTQAGRIPITITRPVAGAANAAIPLQSGVGRRMRILPAGTQDRIYIDVPESATQLQVTSAGTGEVDLYLSRVADPSFPSVNPAPPRESAVASATGPGANHSVTVPNGSLAAGRWYITPVNAGSTTADFTLTATVVDAGTPTPVFGIYFTPSRSGTGMQFYPAGGGTQWAFLMYSYLQDTTPTWYLATAPAAGPGQSQWSAELFRYSWNGEANHGTSVGRVDLVFDEPGSVRMAFKIDGQGGALPLSEFPVGGCPIVSGVPLDATGGWFSPSSPGFGYAVNTQAAFESNGAYFYDDQGYATWTLGNVQPFGPATYAVEQFAGACPLCDFFESSSVPVGTLTRSFDAAGDSGQIALDVELVAPLSGSWTVDLPAVKLTDDQGCN